ncbi:MAG: DUF2225 domain-containing protein [Lachnospirales bacterium]
MNKVFSGIERFGIFKATESTLFKDDDRGTMPSLSKDLRFEEYIFEREVSCPVCKSTFLTPTMRSRKARILESDFDLKPNYEGLESVCYEVVTCTVCGYSSLMSTFDKLTETQAMSVGANVSQVIMNLASLPMNLSIEEAILKFKLALYCCVFKNAKDSEKAFTSLKIAWLYRALGDKAEEKYYLSLAYKGFTTAYNEEDLPFMGMDYHVTNYLLGQLALNLGEYADAKRKLSALLMDKQTPPKIKSKVEYALEELKSALRKIQAEEKTE